MTTTDDPLELRARELEQRSGRTVGCKHIAGDVFDFGDLSAMGLAMRAVVAAMLDASGAAPDGEPTHRDGPYPSRRYPTEGGGVLACCRWIGGSLGDAAECEIIAVIDESVWRVTFGWAYFGAATLTLSAPAEGAAAMWERARAACAGQGLSLPPWAAIRRPRSVLLRGVADSYAASIRQNDDPIDVPRAQQQHAAYAALFAELGIECNRMPADAALPDCCFIEDAAVLWDGGGLLARMAQPARAAESAAVGEYLGRMGHGLALMAEPATLDGGDVLRAGRRIFVGQSSRTNDAGVETLRRVADTAGLRVIAVEVGRGLHLKSSATMLDADTVLAFGDGFDREPFIAAGLEFVDAPEPWGANVLSLGDQIVVSAAAPRTAELIRAHGFETIAIDISELHKGDGALTCLSLRVPFGSSWCV